MIIHIVDYYLLTSFFTIIIIIAVIDITSVLIIVRYLRKKLEGGLSGCPHRHLNDNFLRQRLQHAQVGVVKLSFWYGVQGRL